MSFTYTQLTVADDFDRDGELEVLIEKDEDYYVWLPREAVVNLRDHLNKVLGVAQ